jgi:hypothetical protein
MRPVDHPNVAVIGPGEHASDQDVVDAREVGRLLAVAGAVLLTGGLQGVMAAASQGARSAGGLVIAVLPGDTHQDANEHVTVALPTGLGQLRNGVLVAAAHAVICIGGSWGTLSELAFAMRADVPVVSLGGWRVIDGTGQEMVLPRAVDAAGAVQSALQSAVERTH